MIHNTLADLYGNQCAIVREAQNEADRIKGQLIALGDSDIRGDLFKVVVSDVTPRASVDWNALLASLVKDPARAARLKAQFTSYGDASVRVQAHALPRT